MDTGIGVDVIGNAPTRVSLTNCKVRWAAATSGEQAVSLPPDDVIPTLSSLISEAFVGFVDMTPEFDVEGGEVETYGALTRMFFNPILYAFLVADADLRASIIQAQIEDPDTFLLVNVMDFVYILGDVVHELVGFAPLGGCWNYALVDPLYTAFEATLFGALAGNEAAWQTTADYLGDATADLFICIGEATGYGMVVIEPLEAVSALGTGIEVFTIGAFQSALSDAYDSLSLGDNALELSLTWGETPEDLDLHVWTPDIDGTSHHVSYGNFGSCEDAPYAVLDTDATEGYGPEIVDICRMESGTYDVAVNNYSLDGYLGGSEATLWVRNIIGGLEAIITAPQVCSEATWWHVATIDGNSGGVTTVNQLLFDSPR